jgi:hypothetical protein
VLDLVRQWKAMEARPDLDAATTDRLWLDMTRDVHTATAPVFGMILVRDRLDMGQAIRGRRDERAGAASPSTPCHSVSTSRNRGA